MWRRFELGGLLGSSFEVRVEGRELRLKISSGGRNAREQVRPQPSDDAARREMERLIAAHLAKGYVEVDPLAAPDLAAAVVDRVAERERAEQARAERRARAAEAARQAELQARRGVVVICANAELEAACEAAPDDPAPWAVYADWLAERGDPRGLVAGHALRGDRAGAMELLELHRETLCGTLVNATFALHHGFARAVTLGNATAYGKTFDLTAALGAILAAPIGRFIDEVRTGLAGFGSDNSWQPALAAVVQSPRAPHLRVLRFDNYDYDDCMMHWVDIGDLSALRQLPRLEALHVRGDKVSWGGLALPTLRQLVRETCTLGRAELAEICAAPWPRLEHLELWFGSRQYGVDVRVEDLEPILDGAALPRLGHLGIVNCDLVDELIPRLARSRLLPQLYSLDLSKGTFAREGVAELVRHAAAFRHLAAIELADNFLEPRDGERITAVLDNVVIGPQRELDEGDDDDPAYRYVAEHE